MWARSKVPLSLALLSARLHGSVVRMDRATKLIAAAYERERSGLARESLLLDASRVLIQLWVLRGNEAAHPHILDLSQQLVLNGKVAERCFVTLRGLATYDEGDDAASVRRRALDLWTAVTGSAVRGLREIVSVGKSLTEEQGAEAGIFSAVLRTSAMEIQFTSGAYEMSNREPASHLRSDPSGIAASIARPDRFSICYARLVCLPLPMTCCRLSAPTQRLTHEGFFCAWVGLNRRWAQLGLYRRLAR